MTAIILGGGVNGLWVARSLGRQGVAVILMDGKSDDIAYHSKYVRPYHLEDYKNPASVAEQIIDCTSTLPEKPVVLNTGDRWLLCLSEHREVLDKHVHMVIPSSTSVNTVVDKHLFQQYTRGKNYSVPNSWELSSIEQLQAVVENMTFPVVVKPECSHYWHAEDFVSEFGYTKAFVINERQELLDLWTRLDKYGYPAVIQEFIQGGDHAHYSYMSYRDRNNIELMSAVVKKQRVLPIHSGAATFAEIKTDPEDTIPAFAKAILEDLRYVGTSSVCFKRDDRTGVCKIYEINGRMPLAHSALQIVGLDLSYLAYRDAKSLPFQPVVKNKNSGSWALLKDDIDAFREYRAAGELTFSEWIRSYRNVAIYGEYSADDKGPFFFFLKRFLAGLWCSFWSRQRGKKI